MEQDMIDYSEMPYICGELWKHCYGLPLFRGGFFISDKVVYL